MSGVGGVQAAGPSEERRSPRLVARGVRVEIETSSSRWAGLTTGLNARGLGARLRLIDGSADASLETGSLLAVRLVHPDLPSFPARARVLRVEPSWEAGYDTFAASSFTALDPGLLRCIQQVVGGHRALLAPEKPVRRWFVHRRGLTHGPMTTAEVSAALDQGVLDRSDLAWDYEANEWTPIGLFSTFELASMRPAARLAALSPLNTLTAVSNRSVH